MKILVTGGAGFIGSNFIRYWLKNHPDDSIVNFDKLTYAGHLESLKDVQDSASWRTNYSFIQGDICNTTAVVRAMEGIDIVVHFAAESHVDRSIIDPSTFVKTNVLGTATLLNAAVDKKIKRFHHVSCYDTLTMAFTSKGIKSYKYIRVGDLVMSINPITSCLEWKPVEKIITQPYKGKMISVRTRTTNLLVTPNHRMFFQAKRSKKLSFKTAEQMEKDAINKLPKYYSWKGCIPDKIRQFNSLKDFCYILGAFIGDGCLAYQEKVVESITGLSKANYMTMGRNSLGMFTQIGYVGSNQEVVQRSWRIFLDIPNSDKARQRSEEALTNLGINWHPHKGKAGEHIYFTSKQFFDIFQECGKGAKNKQIPTWALNLPAELLQELFWGLLDSDGSKRRIFYTSSKILAYQFMELSIKLGFSPSISTRSTDSFIGGRRVKGSSYVISLGREWRSIRREAVKGIDYDGEVWCLKVKDNKNFLSIREGKTIFCGNTDEVYGSLELDDPPFTENTPYSPRTPYSASKAGSDHLVRAYFETYGLPITITNCANNFGPFHDPEKLIPRFITNLLEDKKVPLMGRGENVRSWLHTSDHASAIDTVLQKGIIGETYVIGGEEKTNLEVTKKILEILEKDDSFIEYVEHRLGHDLRYAIDDSKLRGLGWKPEHDFDTWLVEVVKWFKENEWWWKPLKEGRPIVDREAQKGYNK